MRDHTKLKAFNLADEVAILVYEVTSNFPREELYGLTSQIRRAAVSVPSNIAEGYARESKKELIRYLYISLGSLSELETQFIISKKLNFLSEESMLKDIEIVRRKLLNLIKYHKGKLRAT